MNLNWLPEKKQKQKNRPHLLVYFKPSYKIKTKLGYHVVYILQTFSYFCHPKGEKKV
jgi:hypothetical protein